MAERNAPRLALRRERDPDEVVLHRLPPRAVRLDRERLRRAQALRHRLKRGERVHDDHARGARRRGRRASVRVPGCADGFSRRRRNTRDEAAELQFAEYLQNVVAGELPESRLVQVERGGRVGRDRHEPLARRNLSGMLPNQVLDSRRRNLVHAPDQLLDAPELSDEFHRRLQANARNAGDIVGRVPGERLHVALLPGLEAAVPLPDGLLVVDLRLAEARREQHPDARGDELQRVRVPRRDQRVHAALRRPRRDCSENVVRFVARRLNDGRAERPHHLLDALHVADEVGRRRRARRLVVGELLMPERRARRIERDRDMRWVVVGERLKERRRKGVHAPDVLARRADGERARLLQSEPRAVDHRVAVHQQQQRSATLAFPFAVRLSGLGGSRRLRARGVRLPAAGRGVRGGSGLPAAGRGAVGQNGERRGLGRGLARHRYPLLSGLKKLCRKFRWCAQRCVRRTASSERTPSAVVTLIAL